MGGWNHRRRTGPLVPRQSGGGYRACWSAVAAWRLPPASGSRRLSRRRPNGGQKRSTRRPHPRHKSRAHKGADARSVSRSVSDRRIVRSVETSAITPGKSSRDPSSLHPPTRQVSWPNAPVSDSDIRRCDASAAHWRQRTMAADAVHRRRAYVAISIDTMGASLASVVRDRRRASLVAGLRRAIAGLQRPCVFNHTVTASYAGIVTGLMPRFDAVG